MKNVLYFFVMPFVFGLMTAFFYYWNDILYPFIKLLFFTMIVGCYVLNTKKRLSEGRVFLYSLFTGIYNSIFSIPFSLGFFTLILKPEITFYEYFPNILAYGIKGIAFSIIMFSFAAITFIIFRKLLNQILKLVNDQ